MNKTVQLWPRLQMKIWIPVPKSLCYKLGVSVM